MFDDKEAMNEVFGKYVVDLAIKQVQKSGRQWSDLLDTEKVKFLLSSYIGLGGTTYHRFQQCLYLLQEKQEIAV